MAYVTHWITLFRKKQQQQIISEKTFKKPAIEQSQRRRSEKINFERAREFFNDMKQKLELKNELNCMDSLAFCMFLSFPSLTLYLYPYDLSFFVWMITFTVDVLLKKKNHNNNNNKKKSTKRECHRRWTKMAANGCATAAAAAVAADTTAIKST